MKKSINYRNHLIEQLAKDKEEALGYLEAAIEAYREDDNDIAAFLIALNTYIASQEGTLCEGTLMPDDSNQNSSP